jgi:diguanylate cyclase (GGDEF)-like protein
MADEATLLEQQVRAKVDSLSYLPTTAAVAIKFVELGKDPTAEPADYAKVIGGDSSLSSKLLALSNSSWFGVRNKVTNVRMAVNLLGLGTVRKLAISYCMAGLHNELRLSQVESRMFWQTSLCKAVAAQQYAKIMDEKLADDGFAAGLFQDFAIPVMYATAKEKLMTILENAGIDWRAKLDHERSLFHLDHSEIGRILGQKLELPDLFVDIVAFHHSRERLEEFVENEIVAEAAYVAALFPHVYNTWNQSDAQELRSFLQGRLQDKSVSVEQYLEAIQKEYNNLYKFFEDGEPPQMKLQETIEAACKESADNTTQMVGTMNEMMQEAATMGVEVQNVLRQHEELVEKSSRDSLTGALNRETFVQNAQDQLRKAYRYRVPYAVIFMDLDKFKYINDTFGHRMGDRALKRVVEHIQSATREHDLLGRFGGDEFVLLLYECKAEDVEQIMKRVIGNIAADPLGSSKKPIPLTISAGVLTVRPSERQHNLEMLLSIADKKMYEAKKAGGNQYCLRSV